MTTAVKFLQRLNKQQSNPQKLWTGNLTVLKAKNGFIERIKERYDRLQPRNDLLIGGKHKGKGTKGFYQKVGIFCTLNWQWPDRVLVPRNKHELIKYKHTMEAPLSPRRRSPKQYYVFASVMTS